MRSSSEQLYRMGPLPDGTIPVRGHDGSIMSSVKSVDSNLYCDVVKLYPVDDPYEENDDTYYNNDMDIYDDIYSIEDESVQEDGNLSGLLGAIAIGGAAFCLGRHIYRKAEENKQREYERQRAEQERLEREKRKAEQEQRQRIEIAKMQAQTRMYEAQAKAAQFQLEQARLMQQYYYQPNCVSNMYQGYYRVPTGRQYMSMEEASWHCFQILLGIISARKLAASKVIGQDGKIHYGVELIRGIHSISNPETLRMLDSFLRNNPGLVMKHNADLYSVFGTNCGTILIPLNTQAFEQALLRL